MHNMNGHAPSLQRASWVKGCPRARGAEATDGVQVPELRNLGDIMGTLQDI